MFKAFMELIAVTGVFVINMSTTDSSKLTLVS